MEDPDGDFDSDSANFLAWFVSLPGTTIHPSLRITDLRHRHAGRGITATTDVPAGDDLFVIPRSAIISAETSDLVRRIPGLFNRTENHALDQNGRDDEDELGDNLHDIPTAWLDLIFILLYEYLHYNTSKWKPYLQVLPARPGNFNTLMFWDSNELHELQASHMTSRIGRSSADTIFRKNVIPLVHEHADIFYPTSTSTRLTDEELLDLLHSMGSLIMSYAFELQPDDDEDEGISDDGDNAQDGWKEDKPKAGTMGMIPMADMLNADAEFNAHLSHGDSSLTMTSLGIKAGDEVLNYYGPLSNGELVRRYGYSSHNHARFDVVELPWALIKSTILKAFSNEAEPKQRRLSSLIQEVEDANDLTNESFVLERDAEGPDDTGHCATPAVFQTPPEELVDIVATEILGKLMGKDNNASEQKRRFLTIFNATLKSRLAQFATSVAEDEQLVLQATGRLRMAINVRHGEKKLLQEAIDWTELKLRALMVENNTNDSQDGPPRKRHKKGT